MPLQHALDRLARRGHFGANLTCPAMQSGLYQPTCRLDLNSWRCARKKLAEFIATVIGLVRRLENVHPLQSGVLRLKHPSERRPGRPRERVWVFWPRFVWETLYKHVILAGVIARLFVSKISIGCDPHSRAYMDRALAPVGDDNDATLDLLTKTAGASAAIAHIRKVAELTRGSRLN